MTTSTKITLGCLAAALFLAFIAVSTVISTNNRFVRLEAADSALYLDSQNVLDNTRKKVREAAAVSSKEVEALTAIIVGNSEARGPGPSGGGGIVSIAAVQEAVPSIQSIDTLKRLQNIVVAARSEWQTAQTKRIENKRHADTMLKEFPSGVILAVLGKSAFEVNLVTSTETQTNFATGVDNGSWIE